jgi:phage tail sheath gpL-like
MHRGDSSENRVWLAAPSNARAGGVAHRACALHLTARSRAAAIYGRQYMAYRRALERDPAAEMMLLATEVADGMAATAAFAATRLSDRWAALGDSLAEVARGTGAYLRARPLVVFSVVATVVAVAVAWRSRR